MNLVTDVTSDCVTTTETPFAAGTAEATAGCCLDSAQKQGTCDTIRSVWSVGNPVRALFVCSAWWLRVNSVELCVVAEHAMWPIWCV